MNFFNNLFIIFMSIGDCGKPVAGDGVMIHPYTTTYEGSSITFTCEDGFLPSDNIIANCTGEGHWTTDPVTYTCTATSTTTTTTRTTTGTTTSTDTATTTTTTTTVINDTITTGEVKYCNATLKTHVNSTYRQIQNILYSFINIMATIKNIL